MKIKVSVSLNKDGKSRTDFQLTTGHCHLWHHMAGMAYVYTNLRFLVRFQLATSKPMLSCSRVLQATGSWVRVWEGATCGVRVHVCWLQRCPPKPQPRVSLFSHNPVQGRGVGGDVQEGDPGQFE